MNKDKKTTGNKKVNRMTLEEAKTALSAAREKMGNDSQAKYVREVEAQIVRKS